MGRPIIIVNHQQESSVHKVELPFHAGSASGPRDVQRAIVHVQAMHMVIPSIHAVFVKPSGPRSAAEAGLSA
jgi:hypothetical protein